MEEKQGSGKALIWLPTLVLTAVVPAFISFYFGQQSAKDDVILSERVSVYKTYIETQRLLDASGAPDASDAPPTRADLDAAKTLLILYSSKAVVEGVADAERAKKEAIIAEEEGREEERVRWMRLWRCETIAYFKKMRSELYASKDVVDDKAIFTILWPRVTPGDVERRCKEARDEVQ